ncbi:molybdopterin-guanine dinucleotide biosynthesis protein B [Planococcus salinus]|uniref:Molybdopterin-guanine dinucleotide biosynthesis protein B n=1 Tax=Planococcus salinus TaxID=1848460 RepID=A0A3M8PC01_9BACL|nr:molybdopterin-guanine dinucleotide biosynthesis protein B [Planococcus salinus]RNF41163.1 molybdopterin-guanine dinucleotide biosynthesis protein B [Planococcus salinus]
MAAVKVLQVVGYKNSGKTTLTAQLLELAQQSGKTVSTIKHHGHGGALETPPAGTDSMQFLDKGAASSLAYGDGVVQLHMHKDQADLKELISLSLSANPDIVLVEGFKQAGYEKIVLVRTPEDWEDLQKLRNIRLVIGQEGAVPGDIEAVGRHQQKEIENWFFQWMEGESDESI